MLVCHVRDFKSDAAVASVESLRSTANSENVDNGNAKRNLLGVDLYMANVQKYPRWDSTRPPKKSKTRRRCTQLQTGFL